MEKTTKFEQVKHDRRMTIATLGGPILLVGPIRELLKFKTILEDKENRHIFIPCPPALMTTEPWLEYVSVKPADITMIVIVDPAREPQPQQRIAVPGQGFGRGPMARS